MKISIDKIRLTGVAQNKTGFQRFHDYYAHRSDFRVCDVYTSSALNKYRNSFTVKPLDKFGNPLEGAFYLAFSWNGSYTDQSPKALAYVIEYNPNKLDDRVRQQFFYYCKPLHKEIKQLDLAFDYSVPRHYVILDKGLHNYMAVGRGSTLTEYICYNKKHSRLKVYDKGAERGNGLTLTRVEVTLANGLEHLLLTKSKSHTISSRVLDDFDQVSKVLECVSIFDDKTDIDPLTRLLITATPTEREIYLNSFGRTARARYRKNLRSVCSRVEYSAFEIYNLVQGLVWGVV